MHECTDHCEKCGALSQLGMLVEENGRSLPPFSFLLTVIASVVLREQPVTVSTTGIKSDAVKHFLGRKKKKMIPERLEKHFRLGW